MSEARASVLRRWFEEVWNGRNAAAMRELTIPDVAVHGVNGPTEVAIGVDQGFRPFYETLLAAFPDIRFTVEATVVEGDMEAVRWTARMTHSGDNLGFAATNQPVTVTGMAFARIADGKIAAAWNNWDMMGMMSQLGQGARDEIVPTARN